MIINNGCMKIYAYRRTADKGENCTMTKAKRLNILKKKSWTGKEVGQLLIASLLNDIKQQGQAEKTMLFSQADFWKVEHTLGSDEDLESYGVYKALQQSILDIYNRCGGIYQQFHNGFHRLLVELNSVMDADEAEKALDYTPLIMTESQYNRLEANAKQTVRGYKASYYSMFFHVLRKCLDAREEAPEPIRAALEATKRIPARDISFSGSYNEIMENGYFALPDGQRSDSMTSEEWKKTIDEYYSAHSNVTPKTFAKSYELLYKGAKAIRKYVLEQTGKSLDGTDKAIEEALCNIIKLLGRDKSNPLAEQIAEALGFSPAAKWHAYEELPQGLTAYDLLSAIVKDKAEPKAYLKAIKTEYAELYAALNAYIEEHVPKARGLKANQLYKDIISWGELTESGVIGYSDIIEPTVIEIVCEAGSKDTTEKMRNRIRAASGGIAILKYPTKSQIDESGDYKEAKAPLLFFDTLYALEGNKEKIKSMQGYVHNLIYPALGYLYAFNTLMEIFSKVYDLPELAEVVRQETTSLETSMSRYNERLYFFYVDVYGDTEEQKHKRTIIKKCFAPLEAELLQPSQEAIEGITKELTELGFSNEARQKLKYLDAFIYRLMESGEGA